ncbi:dienelactone hydrolase family protein [Kineococcus glutinatus]|uniref:Dienelactone hydrolase family protein n=1 Tax=Kineococcus glutinatus TaxID=1070872 RepID=A0ABP9HSL5_9ACTN
MSRSEHENPRQNVTFPTTRADGDDHAHGYLALPPGGSGPGVVVVQEWWGLTDHVVDVVDRFAAEGFVALAPDLYGGRTTHDGEEAARLLQQLPVDRAARDLAGAVDHLLGMPEVTSPAVGAVGFCMGGRFVLVLAAQQGGRIGAAVPWYGLAPAETDFSGLRAAVLGHFGEQDRSVPLEGVRATAEAIRAATGTEPEFHLYPAGHAFYNDERPGYDRGSAELAWGRTTAFLREHLPARSTS